MPAVAKAIQTGGAQAFNVPNDDEGRTFLRLMRKFINRPRWRFRGLGRGPKTACGRRKISHAQAEWIAVYLGGSGTWGQFKQPTLLNDQEEYRLWQLEHGGAEILSGKHKATLLTADEKAYLQLILETYEAGMESPSEKEASLFYGVFQKLVDI